MDRKAQISKPGVVVGFITGMLIAFAINYAQGCTAISHKPPPSDWPKLERITKQVSYWELQKICGTDGIIVQCHGWAWIDFNNMTCTKYFHTDDEYGRLTLEHEEEHCQGKDHMGGSFLADLWERFKRGSAMK